MFDQMRQKFSHHPEPMSEPAIKPAPTSMKEFIDMLRRTPKSVLSDQDRVKISAVMSFDSKIVANLMTPKQDLIFVRKDEFLGPLMLDKLYKSGSTYFPVVDHKNHVEGIIHTESLNSLEIKTLGRASKYLDKQVYYLHELDSLNFAIEEFARTGSPFFLVLDQTDALAGSLSVAAILRYLVG